MQDLLKNFFKSFFKKMYLLIIVVVVVILPGLGPRCHVQASSSCSEQGPLFLEVHGFLIAAASLGEHGL